MASVRTLRAGLRSRPLGTSFRPSVRTSPPASSHTRSFSLYPVDWIEAAILASPLSYPATITLMTIAVRSAFSLPVALWTRERVAKTRDIVIPQMRLINARIAGPIAKQCRDAGKDHDEYVKELKAKLAEHQSALHRQHGTHPLITMAVPFAINIPILVLMSLGIRHAVSVPDSSIVAQSFLWIDQLGEPDSTGWLGILGGVLAFSSAELNSAKNVTKELKDANEPMFPPTPPPAPRTKEKAAPQRVASPAQATKLSQHLRKMHTTAVVASRPAPPMRKRKRAVESTPSPTPSPALTQTPGPRPQQQLEEIDLVPGGKKEAKRAISAASSIIPGIMRLWAVAFIPLSMSMPSAISLYWVISLSYTFVQNLVFTRMDRRDAARRAKRLAAEARIRQA